MLLYGAEVDITGVEDRSPVKEAGTENEPNEMSDVPGG